jgi:glucokinase
MPFGGLYIAGGIAGKNMQIIRKNNQFVRAKQETPQAERKRCAPFAHCCLACGVCVCFCVVLQVNHFLAKGRMRDVLRRMPIYLINFEGVGMLGSKVICRRTIFDALEQNKLNMPLRAKL